MKKVVLFVLALLSFIVCYPVFFLLVGSLMGDNELSQYVNLLTSTDTDYIRWFILPSEPTLQFYVELLLDIPEFFVAFWNSFKMTLLIIGGQMLVGIPAAWGFARYRFKFRNVLFSFYVILMTMPFLVVMLPQYLVLDKLNLLDTIWSIVLPSIFSTFPVFIMVAFFRSIPESIVEAAKIDGAGEFRVFLTIGLPLGSSGIISSMILSFLEYWNLLEQPLVFLKTKTLWPLSLFLPNIPYIPLDRVGVTFTASIVALIPSVLIFLAGQNYLEQGIVTSAVNE